MTKRQDQLLDCFNQLAPALQQSLLDYAAFLAAQAPASSTTASVPEPEVIPRPAEESVVAAIKRLSASYFMLDKPELLNETSLLMSQHVLQGREARAVIDELEALFDRHYQQLRAINS